MNMTVGNRRAHVVGAGVAGLSAAIELAVAGFDVRVLESADYPGGKMRELRVGERAIDAGPTVLTMPWVFEELFRRAGAELGDFVRLQPAEVLARHAWPDGSRLDLYADFERTVEAIAALAGRTEAEGYRAFAAHTAEIYRMVREPFLLGQRPSMWSMLREAPALGLTPMTIDAHRTMARSLRSFFADARLQQLFGRYATYTGSSPFEAPGTLSLIAHVERDGVRYVEGGMARLADALAVLAQRRGVEIVHGAKVEAIEAQRGRVTRVRSAAGDFDTDVVVFAGDAAALAAGLLGPAAQRAVDYDFPAKKRSLSALTLSAVATVKGFPLVRHNVFFAADSKREFDDLFQRRRLPEAPTVYVCAQDRGDDDAERETAERLFFIINAPASADDRPLTAQELDACKNATNRLLERAGLQLSWEQQRWTTPSDFAARFPGSAGALYGRASHGMFSAMARPAARTKLQGLYLAGGTVHPGAGVPMAALSGSLAARAASSDSDSTGRSSTAAIAGSTSTA